MSAVLTAVTSCSSGDWVHSRAGAGWPAQYGDARNSGYRGESGPVDLKLDWTRSTFSPLATPAALGPDNVAVLNSATFNGCSVFAWEADNDGRKKWCRTVVPGAPFAAPLTDQYDNVYLGEPGAMLSFPASPWIRWRTPVVGAPTTARFLGDGNLLVITHLGQLNVLNTQTGQPTAPRIDLISPVDTTKPDAGLDQCFLAGPTCPVPSPPAFDEKSGRIITSVWYPNTDQPVLQSLDYHGAGETITSGWTANQIPGGPFGAPVLSHDGSVVYVGDRQGNVWSLDASSGKTRWVTGLGYRTGGSPSISPDGLLVTAGGSDGQLLGLRDEGDHVSVVFRRPEIQPLSTVTQTAGHLGYTIVRDGPVGSTSLALLVFDTTDGATKKTYPLTGALGIGTGVSVGTNGVVVATTSDGHAFGFSPA